MIDIIMKYYRILLDGNDKVGGLIYAPKDIKSGFVTDAKEVNNSIFKMHFSLKDGVYTHFMGSNIGANFINAELKALLESYLPKDYPLDFIPIQIESNEHGNNEYFLLHFKIIFDVLDKDNTIYIPNTDNIIKPCLSKKKIDNLHMFNSRPSINDVIISDIICKAMKKRKMNIGIEFQELRNL